MIRLEVDSRFYHVEFRHTRRDGAHPTLGRRAPIQAITTCVIVVPAPHEPWHFVAIGNAVCANEDAFSRRRGRQLAFYKAVTQCGALRAQRDALLAAYIESDPDRAVEIRPQLTQAEKSERWQAGWELRKRREARRQVPDAREVFRAAIADEAAERSAS